MVSDGKSIKKEKIQEIYILQWKNYLLAYCGMCKTKKNKFMKR